MLPVNVQQGVLAYNHLGQAQLPFEMPQLFCANLIPKKLPCLGVFLFIDRPRVVSSSIWCGRPHETKSVFLN